MRKTDAYKIIGIVFKIKVGVSSHGFKVGLQNGK